MSEPKRKERLKAIRQAMADVHTMHGSVVCDSEYAHDFKPQKCTCERGIALRVLAKMAVQYAKPLPKMLKKVGKK